MTPAPGDGQLPNISLKNPAAAGTVSVSRAVARTTDATPAFFIIFLPNVEAEA